MSSPDQPHERGGPRAVTPRGHRGGRGGHVPAPQHTPCTGRADGLQEHAEVHHRLRIHPKGPRAAQNRDGPRQALQGRAEPPQREDVRVPGRRTSPDGCTAHQQAHQVGETTYPRAAGSVEEGPRTRRRWRPTRTPRQPPTEGCPTQEAQLGKRTTTPSRTRQHGTATSRSAWATRPFETIKRPL